MDVAVVGATAAAASASSVAAVAGGGGGGSATPTRAQYVSASCIVFTHYAGDTASQVDEHFSRALNFSNKETKGESIKGFCIVLC